VWFEGIEDNKTKESWKNIYFMSYEVTSKLFLLLLLLASFPLFQFFLRSPFSFVVVGCGRE
jgi:hypothetical protein